MGKQRHDLELILDEIHCQRQPQLKKLIAFIKERAMETLILVEQLSQLCQESCLDRTVLRLVTTAYSVWLQDIRRVYYVSMLLY